MKEVEIALSDGTSFFIMTDLGDMLEAALINWEARTTVYTAESFCNYVNSKGLHKCYFEVPPKTEISLSTVKFVWDSITNKMPPAYNIGVIMAGVNKLAETPFTGVYMENGKLLGGELNALTWEQFLEQKIMIGNIAI